MRKTLQNKFGGFVRPVQDTGRLQHVGNNRMAVLLEINFTMRSARDKIFFLVFLLLCIAPLTACGLWGVPIRGQVLETGTDKPVAGAIVIARWTGSVPSIGESRLVCVHVETANSDADGNYRLSGWVQSSSVGAVTLDVGSIVSAYKAGYVQKLHESNTLVHLTPFTGGRKERLEYLLRVSSSTRCVESGASEKNLLPLKKALYEEANAIASAAEDQDMVETLLFGLESLEFGGIAALNRMTERRKVRK